MSQTRIFAAVITAVALAAGSLIPIAAASATNAGEVIEASISGHITAPADAAPIAVIYQLIDGSYEGLYQENVDADGNWQFDLDEAGTYTLSFGDDHEEPLYATVFYGGVVTDDPNEDGIASVRLADGDVVTGLEAELKTLPMVGMPAPVLDGMRLLGQELYADTGDWGYYPIGFTFEWFRDGVLLDETDFLYSITTADLGHRIGVTVTAEGPGYQTTSRSHSVFVPLGKISAHTPKVKGIASVGRLLRAESKPWTSAAGKMKLNYRWYANGKTIKKATSMKYRVPASMRGKKITVKVTAKATGFVSITKTSKKTRKVR
jgi:hypothetical protein